LLYREVKKEARRAQALKAAESERNAGRPQDDGDRLLTEIALIGCDEGVEPRFVVGGAGQHDFDALARLAHDRAVGAIAPLAVRVGDS
jgi:hypothetical protein